MTIVGNVTTLEQLAQEFDGLFQRRVFRLETLDYYEAENEREPFAQFLAGKPVDPAWREPWKARVQAITASGRTMQRVKIVTEPVSDYVRFSLLHGAPASVEAGEEVKILGRKLAYDNWLAYWDYWLFDDDLAALLIYSENAGRVVRVEMHQDGDMLDWLRGEREDALSLATPLAQYVAEHHITDGRQAA